MTTETNDRGESRFDSEMNGHATDAQGDHGHDTELAGAHHDAHGDYIFGVPQGEDAANQTQQVPVHPGDHVIRVQVTPGEILELAPPFTPDAQILGREAHGNLAIKVGDVTVILEGYIDANSKTPVTVETADGKPIDIAVLLASTDPNINIETAAGPGAPGAHGPNADNTGGIFAAFGTGGGLGGFNAVGTQDGTDLHYGTIDSAFRQEITSPTAITPAEATFVGLQEPFLIDPPHLFHFSSGQGAHDVDNFSDFATKYLNTDDPSTPSNDPNNTGADFNGTAITQPITPDELAAALAKTSETITIAHSSTNPERLQFDSNFFSGLSIPTSDGKQLDVKIVDDGATAFLTRDDGKGGCTVVMVFHVVEDGIQGYDPGTTGDFHVEVFLVNRLDQAPPSTVDGSDQNVLTIDFNTSIVSPESESNPEGGSHPGPVGSVDVLDDVPIAGHVEYLNQGHGFPSESTDFTTLSQNYNSNDHGPAFTSQDLGYVDEDWIKGGNKDQDNNPPGSSSDPTNGDQPGHAHLSGFLNINFGADGPADSVPLDCGLGNGGGNEGGGYGNDGGGGNDWGGSYFHDPLVPDASTTALTLVGNYAKGDVVTDSSGNPLTSDGNPLVVLDSYTDSKGVEHLIVGYDVTSTPESAISTESLFSTSGFGEGGCEVKVFELTLNVDPSSKDFQSFNFDLYKGIDQDNPAGAPPEGNTELAFNVIGHDDDGDAVHTTINVQVNDDVPHFTICYTNFEPGTSHGYGDFTESVSGSYPQPFTTNDYGHVDEDWLSGGYRNDGGVSSPGNHDQAGDGSSNAGLNGDDKGMTFLHGQISLNFGGDGPADNNPQTMGLNYNGQSFSAGDTFHNVDGSQVESHGNVLKVLSDSTATHLDIGYHNTQSGQDITVFTLDFNPKSGNFDFCLQQPLDDKQGDNTEASQLLTFDAGQATDADGDTTHAVIKIQVNDDKPEIYTSYDNQTPSGDYGTSSFVTNIITVGPSDGWTSNDYGHVDEDWLSNGNQADSGNFGSTTVTGTLDFEFGADGPSATNTDTTISLAHYTANTVFEDANGNTFASHGQQLYVLSATATDLVVGTQDGTAIFDVHLTGEGNSGFTFNLDGALDHGAPGSPTDTDLPIAIGVTSTATDYDGDHATDGAIKIMVHDDTPVADTSYTNFYGASDPSGTFTSFGNGADGGGYIDEDWLTAKTNNGNAGNQDADGAYANGDTLGGASLTGHVSISYGADGPASNSPLGFANIQSGDHAKDADGNDVKTADGQQVYLEIENDTSTTGIETVIGYTSENGNAHDGTAVNVFVLTLVTDSVKAQADYPGAQNGDFTFVLDQALQDSNPNDSTQEGNLKLSFDGTPTDYDQDPVLGMIQININDDKPYNITDTFGVSVDTTSISSVTAAVVNEDWVAGGNHAFDGNWDGEHGTATATGTVGASFGADGKAATNALTFTGVSEKGAVTDSNSNTVTTDDGQTVRYHISTQNGVETITGYVTNDANPSHTAYHSNTATTVFTITLDTESGAWTYTQDKAITNVNGDDVLLSFGIQAMDGDGTTTTASNVINIAIHDDAPIAVEDDDTASKFSGKVLTNDHPGADGHVTVTYISGLISNDGVDQGGGGTKVTGADGYLVMHADGSWTYTQTAVNPTDTTDTFQYQITDADGTISQSKLVITLANPPVANPDNIYTNIIGSQTVTDAALVSNDLVAVGDTLAVTGAAASSGQSGFFDHGPTHSNSNHNVSFDLDTSGGNSDPHLHNGDTTSFDYTIKDTTTNGTDTGTAFIHFTTSDTVVGSAGNDILTGGDNTALQGGGGNDFIFGEGSHDAIDFSENTTGFTFTLGSGGHGTANVDGTDTYSGISDVNGGSGDDHITGNSSDNIIHGGDGNDTLAGGGGNDHLFGDGGNDVLMFETHGTYDGGTGFDTVKFTSDNDGTTVSRSDLSGNFNDIELLDLGSNGNSDNISIGSANTGSGFNTHHNGVTPSDIIAATTTVGGINSLYITGDSGDNVYINTSSGNFTKLGSPTTVSGDPNIPNGTYDHYQATNQGSHHVTVNVYVEQGVTEHQTT